MDSFPSIHFSKFGVCCITDPQTMYQKCGVKLSAYTPRFTVIFFQIQLISGITAIRINAK